MYPKVRAQGAWMAELTWWQKGIIYQIYPRSFADADGDGVGDLRGIIARLDYLNNRGPGSLGVDAIWLSPFFPSPGFDFGYDVSDYRDVDPLFGSLADFDLLVAEAHRRGIRILLDLVLNHTSHLHPWFAESRSSRANPKRDWYLWEDARQDGLGRRVPPNHWQSVFGGRAWTWDEPTGQFYYHKFLAEQPDLNWRNPDVRRAVLDVFRFWLDRGVDGFRLDVADAYIKDAQWRENPPAFGIRAYERQRHVYDLGQPELPEIYREIRQVLDSYGARMAVGETMGDLQAAAAYCQPGLLPLAFNFEFTRQPWSAAAFQKAILRYEELLGPDGWPCYVLSNHDISRQISRYGGRHPAEVAKVAAALLLTLRGTPFLYYGEEIGMPDGHIRRDQIHDPPGIHYWPLYSGRDPERTPMLWDDSAGAGFSDGSPWLPIHPDHQQLNVETQNADSNSILSFYKRLIWFRKQNDALLRGDFLPLIQKPRDAMAYLRRSESQTMLVALNFSNRPVHVETENPIRGASIWKKRVSTHLGTSPMVKGIAGHAMLALQPFEASIWELGN
jgi:alpha-glucosidase